MKRRAEDSACYVPVELQGGAAIYLRQSFNPSGCGREMVVQVQFHNYRVVVVEQETGRLILDVAHNADSMGRAVWATFRALSDTRSVSPMAFRRCFDEYFGGGAR